MNENNSQSSKLFPTVTIDEQNHDDHNEKDSLITNIRKKLSSFLRDNVNNILLTITVIGLTLIACFISLIKNERQPNYFHDYLSILTKHGHSPILDFSILSIGCILIFIVLIKYLYKSKLSTNVYVVWTIVVAIFTVIYFFMHTTITYRVCFVLLVSWFFFTLIKVVYYVYHWIIDSNRTQENEHDENQNTAVAKLTLVWGVIATVIGYLIRKG